MPARSVLALTTFGGLAVRRSGEAPTELRMQRRRLALLAALAAAGRRGLSRDRLLLLLWPESDAESARNNLKQGIFGVRRDLGGDALLGDAQEVRLNPEIWECDRWAFESALADDEPGKAVAVYGGPFLDGFHVGGESEEFERWADHERTLLASSYRDCLQQLADRAETASDLPAACRWWRRLASLDPLDGRVALGLISATARSGNPAGALQLAREHGERLRAEAALAPDPAIVRLVDQIRAGTFPPPHPAIRPVARVATSPPPSPTTPGAEAPARDPRPRHLVERLREALAGRYVIEGEVGDRQLGGATRSYRASDARHGRAVVLKALHPSLASQLDAQRFLREIDFTARLQHPHIVPLLESGQVDGSPWFTVPALAGESLRMWLGRDPFVPLTEAIRWTTELAGALDYAHRHGVVHRDVSPDNVLLAEGHAFLVNLGVARALASAVSELTETGMLVGSLAYMSPEQASGQVRVDGRSDLYSLACVLYEMLAGEPLHHGATPQAMMARRSLDPTPALEALAGTPPFVTAALRRALAERPDDRWLTAAEFGAALQRQQVADIG